jgi:hypothetical protein
MRRTVETIVDGDHDGVAPLHPDLELMLPRRME